jgi:hypothetical protein
MERTLPARRLLVNAGGEGGADRRPAGTPSARECGHAVRGTQARGWGSARVGR